MCVTMPYAARSTGQPVRVSDPSEWVGGYQRAVQREVRVLLGAGGSRNGFVKTTRYIYCRYMNM